MVMAGWSRGPQRSGRLLRELSPAQSSDPGAWSMLTTSSRSAMQARTLANSTSSRPRTSMPGLAPAAGAGEFLGGESDIEPFADPGVDVRGDVGREMAG